MKLDIHKKESGGGIVLVMTTLFILVVIVAVSTVYTNNITRMVQRSNTLEQAVAIGEGSIDTLFGYWRETCRMSPDPSTVLPASSFTGVPLPTGVWQDPTTQFPDVPNFSATASATTGFVVSNYKVQALDPVDPTYSPLGSNTLPAPAVGRNDGDGDMGKATTTYYYLASTDVTLPTLKGNVSAKVRRVFEKQQISPWNYAIFYVDPLEIHPGDDFNVTGEIHTNATLYTAHNYLHFMDKVTFGIDWDKNFAPGDPRRGVELPTMPSYPANLPPAHDVAHQPFGLDALRIFNNTDGNPNNDSYRELLEKPIAGSPDPLAGKRYYDQACIVIDIAANNTVTITKHADDGKYKVVNAGSDLYDAVMPAISKMTSDTQYIQDKREASKMRLTSLDVGILRANLSAAQDENGWTWNGVIYISDSSPAPSPAPTTPTTAYKPGIRLKNGKVIMSGGLTVASPNPIYIQGDYNTGSGTVPSNATSNNDPTQPQSAGYNRQPCAVLADAVTFLSNSWNDANASGLNALSTLSQRVATNTTVNTAIVSGIVPTTTGLYSGGAENFPRFLEDWGGGKKMTYYGSMVELFNSMQSRGKWGTADVYGVPQRQWYFDNNFQVSTPPGSLMVYSYIKGKWWLAP